MSNRIFLLPTGKLRLAFNLKNPLGTLNQTLLCISLFYSHLISRTCVSAQSKFQFLHSPSWNEYPDQYYFSSNQFGNNNHLLPSIAPLFFYKILLLIRTTNEFSTNINRHNWLIVSLPLFAYSQLPIVLSLAMYTKTFFFFF